MRQFSAAYNKRREKAALKGRWRSEISEEARLFRRRPLYSMTNASIVVRTIKDTSGLRRVDIVRRADGTFTFEEWKFSENPQEMCWIPVKRQMITVAASDEIAEREARARVEWLGEQRT